MTTDLENEEMIEAKEHQDVLLAIRSIIETTEGQTLFKYLFKNLMTGELPAIGMEEPMLRDQLGFIRAGQSVFRLVSEANPKMAGQLLAKVEKERYEILRSN